MIILINLWKLERKLCNHHNLKNDLFNNYIYQIIFSFNKTAIQTIWNYFAKFLNYLRCSFAKNLRNILKF